MVKKNTEETILDVQEVYTKTELFIERNKKTLLGILIAIVVVILAILAYKSLIQGPKMVQSNEDIYMAEMYYMMDSLDAAVEGRDDWLGLNDIAEDYAGTPVGYRANYILGTINRDNGNFEAAAEHFMNADFSSPLLGAFANGNIGDCLVEQGAAIDAEFSSDDGSSDPDAVAKYKEALPYFVKAANSSVDEITTQLYYKKAANVALKLGDYSKASQMYDGILAASTNAKSIEHKEAIKMKAYSSAKASQK